MSIKDFEYEIFKELSSGDQERLGKLLKEYESIKAKIEEFKRPLETKTILEKNLSLAQDKILDFFKKKKIKTTTIGKRRISIRKVPLYLISTDKSRAIASLKRKRLSRFIEKVEVINWKGLRKYLSKNPDVKIPGIKIVDDDESVYIFDLMSEAVVDIFSQEPELYFEIPYNPTEANNEQLRDDWRLIAAHYATFVRSNGKGIKFSYNDILSFAIGALTEIKKRLAKDKIKHTFEISKMKDTTKDLYFEAKKKIREDLKDIGEEKE